MSDEEANTDIGPCLWCGRKSGERSGAYSKGFHAALTAPFLSGITILVPVEAVVCFECVKRMSAEIGPRKRANRGKRA